MSAAEPSYKGRRLSQLKIHRVTWSAERRNHVETRHLRQGASEGLVLTSWADEAVADPDRLLAVSHGDGPDTDSIKIVGFSPSAGGDGALLKIWVWADLPFDGTWHGGSACRANTSDRRRYLEELQ